MNEEYLATRFEMAEQMMSLLALHPADQKVRKLAEEMAKAEDNLVKMGTRSNEKGELCKAKTS